MKVPWTFPYLQHDKNTGPWNQKPGFWNRVCYQLYYLLSLGSSFLTDLRAYTFDTSASPFRPHLHPHLGGHTSLHCLKSCSVLGWNPKSSGSGPRLRLLLPDTTASCSLASLCHTGLLCSLNQGKLPAGFCTCSSVWNVLPPGLQWLAPSSCSDLSSNVTS